MKNNDSGMRLLPLIGSLSSNELRGLRAILVSEEKRTALLSLIDSTLHLQSGDAEVVSAVDTTPSWPSQSDVANNEDKHAFFLLLSDRDAVPSTRDAVKIVNNAFGTRWSIKDFQKRGRGALIDRCWREFQGMSKQDRSSVMSRIIGQLSDASKTNSDYQRLFRFLTRDER